MRGLLGRLCHGRERGPLEPYGTVAPFLRLLAAGTLFIGSVASLVLIAAVALRWDGLADAAAYTAVTAFFAAPLLRGYALLARPGRLSLTVSDPEPRQ